MGTTPSLGLKLGEDAQTVPFRVSSALAELRSWILTPGDFTATSRCSGHWAAWGISQDLSVTCSFRQSNLKTRDPENFFFFITSG